MTSIIIITSDAHFHHIQENSCTLNIDTQHFDRITPTDRGKSGVIPKYVFFQNSEVCIGLRWYFYLLLRRVAYISAILGQNKDKTSTEYMKKKRERSMSKK